MPIYEYECSECAHQFEIIQKMSDDPLVDCPACHAPKLKKLISAAAFRLKGQGWYETDFKKDNRKQLVDTDSKAKDSEAKKTNAKGSGESSSGSSDSSGSESGASNSKSKNADTSSKQAESTAKSSD